MIERLARLGYAAKGVVYSIIGLLALGSVFGKGQVTNQHGAFVAILRQPFGTFLLYVVAVGLLGYALWRVVEAVANPEKRNLATRAVLFVRGVFHGYLAYEVLKVTRGGAEEGAEHWTARVMEKPFGAALLAIAGAAIALYGIGQILAGIIAKVDKRLRLGTIGQPQRRWIVRISRFGVAARGVVFAMIGWFLVQAALQNDPSVARDIGGALREFAGNRSVLATVAIGLLAYGMYELLKARYKRIVTSA